tara:strand:+ start:356 stop:1015 length:660 start_codon:yes stop_codon:yes gene_type:complete
MTTSSEKTYFNLHITGLGYLNRIREVTPKKGESFLACDIAAINGPSDAPEYRRFDVRVSGSEGLLNRRAFSEKLQMSLQARKQGGGSMALMLIDLDGFKPVNDSHGHDQGDELLIEVAERLRETVRDHDVLCRIGGDEFGVILDSLVSEKRAVSIAERILHGLSRQPYLLNGQAIRLSASIGIAIYPGDAECETSLFKQADLALYQAKEDGRGRWCRAA